MTRHVPSTRLISVLAGLAIAGGALAQRAEPMIGAPPFAHGPHRLTVDGIPPPPSDGPRGQLPRWQPPADERTVVANATVRGHDVPVYRIGELQAPDTLAGMDGFAVRVAYVLRAWTGAHGVEAIGNLCRTADGTQWGTVLLTVGAHVASPVTNACPVGMLATGVDIHSHPQRQHYRANAVDEIFLGRLPSEPVTTLPDTFGPDDYGHPGYMVGRVGLHYQHGLDRVRLVRDMRLPPPIDPAADTRRIAGTHEAGPWLVAVLRKQGAGVVQP